MSKPTRPFRHNPEAYRDPGFAAQQQCPACQKDFVKGDWVALVALGPGDSEEEQERARAGRAHNAVAIPVHWACAGGDVADAEAYFDKHFAGWRTK